MAENLSVSDFEKRYGKASLEPDSLSIEDFESRYGTPDPSGIMASSGPAGRAAAQVLAPKNPRAMLGALSEAVGIAGELPGAVGSVLDDYTSGALKGLGRMAAPAVKAIGLGNDYTDAALTPENDLEGYAGTGAQMGATTLATMALGGPLLSGAARAGVPAAVLSPGGLGTIAAVGTKAAGGSNWDAAQNAVGAASFGKLSGARPIVPGRGVIKPIPGAPNVAPKATVEQMKAAVEAGPRGNAAKAALRAKKASEQAPKPVPEASIPPVKPSTVAETAKDVDSALGSLSKASQARLKHVVKKAESKMEASRTNSAIDDRTDIAKYYNLDPVRSMANDAVKIHPKLGLPMNAEGKVMIRTLEGKTTWHTPEYAQNMADILKARSKISSSVEDVAQRLKEGLKSAKSEPVVDRMKVPKVGDNLAREQREGLAEAMKKFGPDKMKTGGDVVYAPPAFKGQQSSGTKAKFEFQAKRQAKLREDAIKADAQARANELGLKVRELKNSGKTPTEIRDLIAEETGFDADSVSQLVNIALKVG